MEEGFGIGVYLERGDGVIFPGRRGGGEQDVGVFEAPKENVQRVYEAAMQVSSSAVALGPRSKYSSRI